MSLTGNITPKGAEHSMGNPKKIGLVLSGGGAKGAYEAGVWAGLEQIGLTPSIDGIIGASVGALNAVLFDNSDTETAANIWLNLKKSDLLNIDKAEVAAMLLSPLFAMYRASIWGILLGGSFSQKRLEAIMKEHIDFSRGTRSLYAVCTHAADLHSSEVFSLSEYEPELRKQIVLASSALPLIYKGIFGLQINGTGYLDGGISDNTPRMKLRARGWRQTVTVWLTNEPDRNHLSDDDNIDIIPSRSLGGFLTGTIRISKKKLKADYDLGIEDVLLQKERLLQMAQRVEA